MELRAGRVGLRPLRVSDARAWNEVRARTADSPYAAPFFTLVERLGIVPHAAEPQATKPRIRVA